MEQRDMSISIEGKLRNKLMLLANCFWNEHESRDKIFAKFVMKHGKLHQD